MAGVNSSWYHHKYYIPWDEILNVALTECVPAHLFTALIQTESSFIPTAIRREPNWKYFYRVDEFANQLDITPEEEEEAQRHSYGYCQIMGSVARENGFIEKLENLLNPTINLRYGAKVFNKCLNRFPFWWDAVAAYNGGPGAVLKKFKNKYPNQIYVDRVRGYLNAMIPHELLSEDKYK